MINFKKDLLGEKLLDDICKSFELGLKRDLLSDCKKFIHANKIKFNVSSQQKSIQNTPTIIVSNHYKRPFLARKSFLTTVDSMITSSIITVSLAKITQRKTIWVIKDNLLKNILFYDFKPRQVQMAAVHDYDFIPVSTNYPFSAKSRWLERLKSGHNIALYPEGVISTKLRQSQKGFARILSYLAENNIKVQILPVGVYSENGIFKINFGKVFLPNNLKLVEDEVMFAIATNLPFYLRGAYSTFPKGELLPKFPVHKQLEGDQKPELAVRKVTSA